MNSQISIFSMLDSYETPMLRYDEQKAGTIGWVIRISGIFLKKNGCNGDYIGICTRPVLIERDTESDGSSFAHSIKGSFFGWYGGKSEIFKFRPSWNDCLKYAKDHREKGMPKDVMYYDRTGDMEDILDYENGY